MSGRPEHAGPDEVIARSRGASITLRARPHPAPAQANGQGFAWVSVEEPDNDPKVLLTYVAEALDEVEPVGERVFAALASPGSSVPGSVVPRLGRRLRR